MNIAKNTFHRIAGVFLALWVVATMPNAALAETVHYWRFENNLGFLVDSAGSADLTGAGGAQQALLPEVGRGGSFPHYLSVSQGEANADAQSSRAAL